MQSSKDLPLLAPMLPLVVNPHVCHKGVRTCIRHAHCLVDIENIRRGEKIHFVRQTNHLHLLVEAHASLLEILPKRSVDQTYGGEVLHTTKCQSFQLAQKLWDGAEWIRATSTSKYTGRLNNR